MKPNLIYFCEAFTSIVIQTQQNIANRINYTTACGCCCICCCMPQGI